MCSSPAGTRKTANARARRRRHALRARTQRRRCSRPDDASRRHPGQLDRRPRLPGQILRLRRLPRRQHLRRPGRRNRERPTLRRPRRPRTLVPSPRVRSRPPLSRLRLSRQGRRRQPPRRRERRHRRRSRAHRRQPGPVLPELPLPPNRRRLSRSLGLLLSRGPVPPLTPQLKAQRRCLQRRRRRLGKPHPPMRFLTQQRAQAMSRLRRRVRLLIPLRFKWLTMKLLT